MLKNLALSMKEESAVKGRQKLMALLPYCLCGLIALVFARGSLLRELFPFGTGLIAGVCLVYPELAWAALIGSALGFLTVLSPLAALVYSLTPLALCLFLWKKAIEPDKPVIMAAFAASCHCLIRGLWLLLRITSLYDALGLVIETLFIFVMTLAIWYAAQGLEQWQNRRQPTLDSRCGMILFLLALLLGLEGLTYAGLSVQNTACRFILLWAAYVSGPGAGAAVGVAVGLLPIFMGYMPLESVTFYAAAGLLAGTFRSFHKLGSVVGFVLANLLLAPYYLGSSELLVSILETALAAGLFLLLPIQWLNTRHKDSMNLSLNMDGDGEESGIYNQQRLYGLGEAFIEIQDLLERKEENREAPPEGDALIEEVCNKVCYGCAKWQHCWWDNRQATGSIILNCGRKYHQEKCLGERDIDPELLIHCPRSRELAATISGQVERFLLMEKYERQLSGSRVMVAQQLAGLGGLLREMAKEEGEYSRFCSDQRQQLLRFLKEEGLPVRQVAVDVDQDQAREIRVVQSPCKDRKRCREMLAPLAGECLGLPQEIRETSCPVLGGNTCVCTLVPKAELEVTVGAASCPMAGQRISGDVSAALYLPGRERALVISDGMGHGDEAHQQSHLALELLERFLKTGLSPKMAVKTVNTAMVLNNDKESFATLDLVLIDEVSGRAEFVKAGSAPSLIWTKGRFQTITAGMPPAGILDQMEPKSFVKTLLPEDVIITMSDGAWEALEALDGSGNWLELLMPQLSQEKPEHIADYLLYMAKGGKEAGGKDDMCVQVARVERRRIA